MVLREALAARAAALESTRRPRAADEAEMVASPAAGFDELRLARIAVLRQRIAAGSYRVSSEELAGALLRSMLR